MSDPLIGEGEDGMDDAAIDQAAEAGVIAAGEEDGRGKLHVHYRKLLSELSTKERARAEANVSRRVGAIQAKALLADPEHPGNEGKKADSLLKADEATRKMDARQGYERPETTFTPN